MFENFPQPEKIWSAGWELVVGARMRNTTVHIQRQNQEVNLETRRAFGACTRQAVLIGGTVFTYSALSSV